MEECWPGMNELEQAWTGVEETDCIIISKLAPQNRDRMYLIMVCPLQYNIQKLSELIGILYGPSEAGMDRP